MFTKVDFKGILADLTFKYFFSNEEILKDFINSYFEYINIDKKFYFSNIEVQSYIKAPIRDLKNYYGDIIATLNTGEIINIEAYKTFSDREYRKSFNYLCRLYSNQIKEGIKTYENSKKVISLNLINGNYKKQNKELVNVYEMENKITKKVLDNGEIEMILVRLDLINNIQYNEFEERFIRWLKLINAKTIEELEKYAKGDKLMEQSVEYVKRYLNGPLNHTFEDYILEKQLEAKEEGETAGILATAKNLLNLNIDIKDISKATGLSEKDLKKLMD